MIENINSATDNCHNLKYVIDLIEQYQDELSKKDIISILNYYYLFNKDMFDGIL